MLCRSKDARWTPGKGAKVLDDCIGGARIRKRDVVRGGMERQSKGDNDRDRGGRETGQKIKVHSLRKKKEKTLLYSDCAQR